MSKQSKTKLRRGPYFSWLSSRNPQAPKVSKWRQKNDEANLKNTSNEASRTTTCERPADIFQGDSNEPMIFSMMSLKTILEILMNHAAALPKMN